MFIIAKDHQYAERSKIKPNKSCGNVPLKQCPRKLDELDNYLWSPTRNPLDTSIENNNTENPISASKQETWPITSRMPEQKKQINN